MSYEEMLRGLQETEWYMAVHACIPYHKGDGCVAWFATAVRRGWRLQGGRTRRMLVPAQQRV